MIDGSSLPFDENVELTREVVKYAHEGLADRVDVKGSLGVVILLGSIQNRFHWNQ